MNSHHRFSTLLCIALVAGGAFAQAPQSPPPNANDAAQVRLSTNLVPHFEQVNGRKVLYVDGKPFTVLAVEIPWWDLIAGKHETHSAYDYLYPAAEKMGLNALKVPVKWAMVEPQKGQYDFSYVDHAKSMAEQHHLKLVLNWFGHYASADGTIYGNLTGEAYAPQYIIEDEKTYPRAVDADGVAHHNVASYDYDAIIDREIAAFRAFMQHIKDVDSAKHTILMIQVENEIAVFGFDRHNRKLWRDHSAAANRRFQQSGITDDLKYSAWDLSHNWIRRITDAGAQAYPLPFFHNFVGGTVADWMVGGSPGEDVQTYLNNVPNLSFIGVNFYDCAQWLPDNSCAKPAEGGVEELRAPLRRYHIGRNLPAITETNSGPDAIAQRLVYLAVGEFGAPLFAPWALTDSYPTPYAPYVLHDGTLANGAFALRDAYTSLNAALAPISYFAASDKLKVFMAPVPAQRFASTQDVGGFSVKVDGDANGEAIVVHPAGHDFTIVGYRCGVTFKDPVFVWPAIQGLHVERGHWDGDRWVADGPASYNINQSDRSLNVDLPYPQAVHVTW